jgi:dienelactone hydrolase
MQLRTLFFVVVVCNLSACASIEALPDNYQTPAPLPDAYLKLFCYPAVPVQSKLTLVKDKTSYRVFTGAIEAGPVDLDDETPITFEFYEQKGSGLSPVVLIMPILNGQKDLMRPFAKHFARKGYAVVIIDTVQRRTLLQDLKDPEPAIYRSIQRHRRVIDWVETRSDIDAGRIALFGASLGGFNALFLAALDERVSAAALALVGGSLPDVLVKSNERRVEEAISQTKKELSLNDEALIAYLEEQIATDPLVLAPHMNAARVLLVQAKHDKAVPFPRQMELREAMARPETITLPTGHITAAAYLFYLRSRTARFFDRKLAEESTYGTAIMPASACEEVEP